MACFDTSFIIDLMREKKKGGTGPATRKLQELRERNEAPRTTIVNVGELYVGPYKVRNTQADVQKLENLLAAMEVLDMSLSSARRFGELVAALYDRGTPIGAIDVQIASIVLDNDEVLITRDLKHFERVPGLKLETY
jgi:tRNA(fMet)-specific endonuclease VapC